MSRPRQLSGLLHAVGCGRRPVPSPPPPGSGVVDAVQRVVEQFGAARPVQADPTTCGSAALVVLAAAGDASLARWLATGRVQGPLVPPELGWLSRSVLDVAARATPTARFGALQQAMKRVTLRRGLGLLPWPGGLGTPPWGAARAARFGALRYTGRLVVDTRPEQAGPLLDHAAAVARAGVPVLLYTGGDTGAGLAAGVPRHVVVLASPDGYALETYEPGSGRMLPITHGDLAAGGTARAAYGGWSHVTWVVVPR